MRAGTIAVVFTALLSVGAAQVHADSGTDLQQKCATGSSSDECAAFINRIVSAIMKGPHPLICFPADYDSGRSVALVQRYMQNHPGELNNDPVLIIRNTMLRNYPCKSQDSPPASASTCMDTAMSQAEINACARAKAQEAEDHLKKSYQAVLCYLDAYTRAKLEASQRAWESFRDADCAFWGAGDGTIARANYSGCRAQLAQDRTKELDGWPPNTRRSALVPCKS